MTTADDPALARWSEPCWDLAALIQRQGDALGPAPYLSFARDSVQLSFADVDERSGRLAGGLAELGVRRGDHVVIMSSNRAEFVLTWFALAKLGAVQVPVNTAYRGSWLQHVVITSGAAIAVVEDELLDAFAAVDVPGLTDLVVIGEPAPIGALRGHRFDELEAAPAPSSEPAQLADLAAVHFTSGTTGRSKGAAIPLPAMDLLTRRNAQLLDLTPESVYSTELPLFHINAQMTVQGALLAGARAHVEERFSATQWLERLRAVGATHTSMLGVMVDFVLAQPPTDRDLEQPLRAVWTVPCVPAAVERLRARFGIERIVTSYGTTELGMLARRVVAPGSSDTSSGPVDAAHYTVQIVDPVSDELVPTGEVGELVVRPRAPWTTMTGYVAMPERTIEAYRNLWMHSGDCARLDADGNLHFVDRLHDRIRRRGENVASADLEHELAQHPAVVEVAVIPVPATEDGGEDEIKACVVTREDFDLDEFWAWCDERLPSFAVPRYVERFAELPKTPTAKVLKTPLRESARNERTADRGPRRVRSA
jgi:crotonobetaine/carnitine-CoA ligase